MNKDWTKKEIVNGYFVSTAYVTDYECYETMVFPASKDAREVKPLLSLYGYWEGVDFYNPLEEYTRHYDNLEDATVGHEDIAMLVKEREPNEA